MGNLAPLVLAFVRNLSKAIRAFRIYAPDHRETQKSIEDAAASLRKLIQEEPALVLGTRDGNLIFQNVPLHDDSAAVKGFCEMLSARNLATFRAEPGFTNQELLHLIKILAMSPEDVLQNHAIKKELLAPLHSIRVNELRFIAVDGSTPEGSPVPVAPGMAVPADVNLLLSALLTGAPGQEGSATVAVDALKLQSLASILAPFLNAPDKAKAFQLTSGLFDQIVDQSLAEKPAAEFVDEYLKGVGSLPEEVRKAVIGSSPGGSSTQDAQSLIERLPIGLRGRVVADDLRKGTTAPGRLRATTARLASSPKDFVKLYEIVSRMTAESSATAHEAERRSEEVLQLLPLSEEMSRKRRSILLVSREPADQLALTRMMEEAGFLVSVCAQPDGGLVPILRSGAFDGVVADLSRYHLSELQPLAKPGPGPALPPVALLEDTLRVRDAAESSLYPDGRVLYKPVERSELLALLNEVAPGEAVPPPPTEEVEQTREMKPYLQPGEIASIPGYTIAAFYRPGSSIGGNFHDVIAISESRFGFLFLDVPGPGAFAAAALFAARTCFLREARRGQMPAQTLTQLNPILSRALPRGMIVRAGFAVLDRKTGELGLASAGFPRPLRWTDGNPTVKVIQAEGLPLGPVQGHPFERSLHAVTVKLMPGDHVMFCTDGVSLALNPALKTFGERRTAQAARLASEGFSGPAVADVVEAVLSFSGSKPLSEDLTLLELHRLKEASEAASP